MSTSQNIVRLLAALSVASLSASTLAQAQQLPVLDGKGGIAPLDVKPGPQPLSVVHGVKMDFIPGVSLRAIDNDALWAQDQALEAAGQGNGVKRMSVEVPLEFDWNAGQWYDAPNGAGRLWVLDVVSPTAWGVRLHVSNFELPTGAQMTVYAPDDLDGAPWPYEGKGRRGTGEFWARTAFGNTARVEVFVPRGVTVDEAMPLFTIDKVHHWYINMRTGTPSAFQTNELGCHRDVTCETWPNEAAGVCLIYMNGGSCSATLLNTFAGDWTPYMYTAAHCFNNQAGADSLETYWFFQTTSCNGTVPSLPTGINRADDATLLSTGTAADHTLVMIEGTIRRDLYWQGWDPNAYGNGNTNFGIHHPGGTYKRWSTGTTSATGVGCSIAGIGAGVTGIFSTGTSEPGSSGSPLFDDARRVRGALSCANGVCTAARRFYYGPFSVAYPSFSTLLNGGSDDGVDGSGFGDTCANAFFVAASGNGGLNGLVVKSVDEDWYSFTVPAGGSITLSTSFVNAWGDIDNQMFDACTGVLLSSSTSGSASTETTSWTNPSNFARTVTLRVYLFNDTRANYNLSYNIVGVPAPSNDACFNALALANGQTLTGNTQGATTDGATTCGVATAKDVWFSYFAPCSTTLSLSTAESSFDTVLSVHSTCPGNATNQLACNDDNGVTLTSFLSLPVVGGQQYLIRVSGYNGASGNYSLSASVPGFFNDECVNAISLPAGSFSFDSCGGTSTGPSESACGGAPIGADFWNSFTPDVNGFLTADTLGATFDTQLAVYDSTFGCPGAPDTAIACNDDFAPPQRWSQVGVPVVAGVTYLIRTGGYFSAQGFGTLTIGFVPDATGCDSIDFNRDGLFPDDLDLLDFLSVLAGGACSTAPDPDCSDLDFNNDGLFPDDTDLIAFLTVLAGGDCPG